MKRSHVIAGTVAVLAFAATMPSVSLGDTVPPAAGSANGFLLPRAIPDTAPVNRIGTIKGTVQVKLNSFIVNGTDVSLTLTAGAVDKSYAPTSSVAVSAQAKNGTVTFDVALPYEWLVSSSGDKAYVTADLGASPIVKQAPYSYSQSVTEELALPANGAVTSITIHTGL